MNLQSVTDGANNLVPINDNSILLDWSTAFGNNPETTHDLIWGYLGTPVTGTTVGYWGGNTTAAGTATLANNSTTYQVVLKSTGVVSFSTSNTNWNNTASYSRCYSITTLAGVVTAVQDHRAGPYGVCGGPPGTTAGRHMIPIMAASMAPSFTGGCAALAVIASAANQPDIVTLDFDPTTQEYAQFSMPMLESWDEGTITFKAIWRHAATTTNFGVAWDLQAIALSDDDAIAQNFGTAQVVTDTGGTTNDHYVTAESSAITIAGTPAAGDTVFFRLSRVTGNGADTMAIDAGLIGIRVYITTNAENDA